MIETSQQESAEMNFACVRHVRMLVHLLSCIQILLSSGSSANDDLPSLHVPPPVFSTDKAAKPNMQVHVAHTLPSAM
jgi:hypothetical protein